MNIINSLITFVLKHHVELTELIIEHTKLTLTSVAIAILIGIPLGIMIANIKAAEKPVLGFANIMQAVPSLAALGLLVPVMGIGSPPAIFMVVLYSLLPIIKNTYTGLKNIDSDMIEAAYGIGMTHRQVLFRIKLPLALPVIMSGVRIASVTAVGLMTLAAYIGAGGLGNYVISGIQTSNTDLMLSGAIPACILALIMDFCMSKIEKAVIPVSMSLPASALTPQNIHKHKRSKRFTLSVAAGVIVILAGCALVPVLGVHDNTVTVSSKPEVEGQIVGNMLSEVIEEHTGLKVEKKLGLGASTILYEAIINNEIDIYPEYSGSAYGGIYNKIPEPGTSAETLMADLRKLMKEDGLIYSDPYGLNNRYSIGVLPEFAEKYDLKTISDLEELTMTTPLTLACDQEFPNRQDGFPAMEEVYTDLKFDSLKQFQGALMYDAMINGEVDVMTPFTTDALMEKYDIQILKDDKNALTNYNMASVISEKTANEHPELLEAVSLLENNISDEEITKLNYEVVVNGRSVEEVAHEFLVEKDII